jgi:hypothetical protein
MSPPSIFEAIRPGQREAKRREPARVHRPDERPAYAQAATVTDPAAERKRKREAAKAAADRARAERTAPRPAPAWQLSALLHGKRESWSAIPIGRERPEPVLTRDTAEVGGIMDTATMRRLAEPPKGIARHKPAVPPATTAAAILERLAQRGVTVERAPDGNLVVIGPAGYVPPECATAVATHHALIAAHLDNRVIPCSWCGEPAVLQLVGGAVACERHP